MIYSRLSLITAVLGATLFLCWQELACLAFATVGAVTGMVSARASVVGRVGLGLSALVLLGGACLFFANSRLR